MGNAFGKTSNWNKKTCDKCKYNLMSNTLTILMDELWKLQLQLSISRNIIHHTICQYSNKIYVGKTTQTLGNRINGHHSKFYQCIKKGNLDKDKKTMDDYLLGLHLYSNHKLRQKDDFNNTYKFTILETCNPRHLDGKEHWWIQKLKCVAPYGLNSHDPFGILILL